MVGDNVDAGVEQKHPYPFNLRNPYPPDLPGHLPPYPRLYLIPKIVLRPRPLGHFGLG